MSVVAVFEKVGLSYGDRSVLRDLSWTIPAGKVTALLGPTGSGKTSLLRLIADLEKTTTGRLQRKFDLEKIGFVFQNSNLVPWLSGEENLRLCLKPESDDGQISSWAQRFALQNQMAQKVHQLSGGQKQKLNLLRGFLNVPALLLLDEPFTGLDPSQKQNLYEIFFALKSETANAAVLVTHDIDEALLLADRICLLSPVAQKIEAEIENPIRASSMAELRGHAEYLRSFSGLSEFFRKYSGALA